MRNRTNGIAEAIDMDNPPDETAVASEHTPERRQGNDPVDTRTEI